MRLEVEVRPVVSIRIATGHRCDDGRVRRDVQPEPVFVAGAVDAVVDRLCRNKVLRASPMKPTQW